MRVAGNPIAIPFLIAMALAVSLPLEWPEMGALFIAVGGSVTPAIAIPARVLSAEPNGLRSSALQVRGESVVTGFAESAAIR